MDNTGIAPEHIKPFRRWLTGQTVPVTEDGKLSYYKFDYERWKESNGIISDDEVRNQEPK